MSYPIAALAAIANPSRARILERLQDGEKTVGELAEGLPVSRPAISQHLRVLEQAGLVSEEFRGTRHIYRIDLNGFAGIRTWLDRFWTDALENFAAEVDRQNRELSSKHAKPRRPDRS